MKKTPTPSDIKKSQLKETKKKIFQEYTKFSKTNKQQHIQNNQAELKKQSNQKVILQQISIQNIKKQLLVAKKIDEKSKLEIQIIKSNFRNFLINIEKPLKVQKNAQKLSVKANNTYLTSFSNQLQKENQKFDVMPCMVIQGKKKEILSQATTQRQNKNDIQLKGNEKQKKEQEEEKLIVSGDNCNVDNQLHKMNERNSCQNFESNRSDKRKEGILEVKIQIKNLHEQNVKMNQFNNQIKDSNKQISLKLDTTFENYQSLLNFCTKFIKFGNDLVHLKWYVRGYFSESKQSNLISDLVSRFTMLNKFIFEVNVPYFSNSTAESFSSGLKQLKNLKIFHFNIRKDYQSHCSNGLRDKAHQPIINAIQQLPNLQIMSSNIELIQSCSPPPCKMSNFVYNYNLNNGEKIMKKNQEQNLKSQNTLITMLTLKNQKTSNHYEYKQKECIQDTLKLFSLPYLTSCYFARQNKPHQVEVSQIITVLRKLIQQKMRNLLQILSFKKQVSEFIPLNPAMLMTDLWFD